MDKKILTLLAVFIVAISMASVCAAELTKENDFDGLFKMKIAENDNFTNMSDGQDYSTFLQSKMAYKNGDGSIFAFVYNDNVNQSIFYASHDKIQNFDTDGDLSIINATDDMSEELDGNVTVLAGKSNGDDSLTVFVGGTDENLVKEYSNTIEF